MDNDGDRRRLMSELGCIYPEHVPIPANSKFEAPVALYGGVYMDASTRIGAFTYSWSPIPAVVGEIGRYCSIAHGISFGEFEHPTDWFTTSSLTFDGSARLFADHYGDKPFHVRDLPVKLGRWSKISIGNDVWIGSGAYIRAGVTLGDGCIIGARAVVTKNVPAYAVCVGNPGKVIKYRFPPEKIQKLLDAKWWQYHFADFAGLDYSNIDAVLERAGSGIAPLREKLV